MSAIRATRLGKRFHGRDVLVDVQLNIAQGECLAVVGDNAAGKTTLLRCLSGAARPTSGIIHWFGEDQLTADVRRIIGSLAHDTRVYAQLTVRENLVFAARMYDVPQPKQRADDALDRCGLARVAHELVVSLSRGTCQRVALARAIVHDPQLIFLDEPFTGLDSVGTAMLIQLISNLKSRDRTICLTTHQLSYLRPLATRVVRLHDGHLHDVESESVSAPVGQSKPEAQRIVA